MDTLFMDKLSQRLTAQEIIKANTAADTEELNNLRSQLAAYNECLDRLQRLINEGEAKLSGARQIDNRDVRYLVEEGLNKIRTLQPDVDGMERLQKQLAEQLNSIDRTMVDQLCNMDKAIADQIAGIDKNMEGRLAAVGRTVGGQFAGMDKTMEKKFAELEKAMGGQFAGMDKAMEKRLTSMSGQLAGIDKTVEGSFAEMGQKMEGQLDEINQTVKGQLAGVDRTVTERLDALGRTLAEQTKDNDSGQLTENLESINGNVHKECVKVYRNVQAVVVEECGKQTNAVNEANASLNAVKTRQGAILGLSVAALIFSLAGVAMQILGMLNII